MLFLNIFWNNLSDNPFFQIIYNYFILVQPVPKLGSRKIIPNMPTVSLSNSKLTLLHCLTSFKKSFFFFHYNCVCFLPNPNLCHSPLFFYLIPSQPQQYLFKTTNLFCIHLLIIPNLKQNTIGFITNYCHLFTT